MYYTYKNTKKCNLADRTPHLPDSFHSYWKATEFHSQPTRSLADNKIIILQHSNCYLYKSSYIHLVNVL